MSSLDLRRRADAHRLRRVGVGDREGRTAADIAVGQFRPADRGAPVLLGSGEIFAGFTIGQQRDRQLADAKDDRGEVDAPPNKVAMAELCDFKADALGKMPDRVDIALFGRILSYTFMVKIGEAMASRLMNIADSTTFEYVRQKPPIVPVSQCRRSIFGAEPTLIASVALA